MNPKDIAETLGRYRDLLNEIAEGGPSVVESNEFRKLRDEILSESKVESLVPEFVYEQRSPRDFWNYIQRAFSTYRERTRYIEVQLLPIERQFRQDRQKAPGDRLPEVRIEYLPAPPTASTRSAGTPMINKQRITELRSITS